jgi:hypothetical protein
MVKTGFILVCEKINYVTVLSYLDAGGPLKRYRSKEQHEKQTLNVNVIKYFDEVQVPVYSSDPYLTQE